MLAENRRVQFAAEVGQYIGTLLREHSELATRVRFVTPIDLYDIFGRMNWAVAKDLRWWFIGKSTAIRYDTPKIVEAVVRLRLLGTGVPVFRLDYDVLFKGDDNKTLADLGMFKTVASCLRAYRLRMDEPSVATFLISASYDTRALKSPKEAQSFRAWSGAFATRVFPALPVVPDELQKVDLSEGSNQYSWETYANKVFDEALARRFYGLALESVS